MTRDEAAEDVVERSSDARHAEALEVRRPVRRPTGPSTWRRPGRPSPSHASVARAAGRSWARRGSAPAPCPAAGSTSSAPAGSPGSSRHHPPRRRASTGADRPAMGPSRRGIPSRSRRRRTGERGHDLVELRQPSSPRRRPRRPSRATRRIPGTGRAGRPAARRRTTSGCPPKAGWSAGASAAPWRNTLRACTRPPRDAHVRDSRGPVEPLVEDAHGHLDDVEPAEAPRAPTRRPPRRSPRPRPTRPHPPPATAPAPRRRTLLRWTSAVAQSWTSTPASTGRAAGASGCFARMPRSGLVRPVGDGHLRLDGESRDRAARSAPRRPRRPGRCRACGCRAPGARRPARAMASSDRRPAALVTP